MAANTAPPNIACLVRMVDDLPCGRPVVASSPARCIMHSTVGGRSVQDFNVEIINILNGSSPFNRSTGILDFTEFVFPMTSAYFQDRDFKSRVIFARCVFEG